MNDVLHPKELIDPSSSRRVKNLLCIYHSQFPQSICKHHQKNADLITVMQAVACHDNPAKPFTKSSASEELPKEAPTSFSKTSTFLPRSITLSGRPHQQLPICFNSTSKKAHFPRSKLLPNKNFSTLSSEMFTVVLWNDAPNKWLKPLLGFIGSIHENFISETFTNKRLAKVQKGRNVGNCLHICLKICPL